MGNYDLIIDALIPALFLYYGGKLRFRTPPFGDKNGIGTKYSKQSEEAWLYGNQLAGTVLLMLGVLFAVLVVVKRLFFANAYSMPVELSSIALGILLLFLFIPFINARIKKKFNLK